MQRGAAAAGGGRRQRDGDERRLALAWWEREEPRAKRSAKAPGSLGGEAAKLVLVAGLLGDEDRWLLGRVAV